MNLKCRTLSDHQKGWLPLKKKENNFKTRVEICSIALLFGIFIIGLGMMLYSVSLSNMEGAEFMKNGCVISCMALSMATSVTLNFAEYNDGAYGFGFIFLALISGFFVEKFSGNIVMAVIGMVLGTAVTYAFGTIWLCAQMHLTFVQGLYAGVIPYLPGDAAKIVIAIIVGSAVKKAVVKARVLPE